LLRCTKPQAQQGYVEDFGVSVSPRLPAIEARSKMALSRDA